MLSNNTVESVEDREWVGEIAVFDEEGRLLEEASAERSLVEQEPFRSVYIYGAEGRVAEKRTFNEDGSADGITKYIYDAEGNRTEEIYTSAQGSGSHRTRYDARGNLIESSWYRAEGPLTRKQVWNYTYKEEGNRSEEHYFIEEEVPGSSSEEAARLALYVPFGFQCGETSFTNSTFQRKTATHKRVITYDDAGHKCEVAQYFYGRLEMREKYDAEGRIIEKTGNFDDQGVPHDRSIYTYDDDGKMVTIHQIMSVSALIHEPVNRKYFFTYDQWGNITEFVGFDEDGSLDSRESYEYEYDWCGNWTKMTKTWVTKAGHKSVTVNDREITYF
jgi:YD repeat-containing protein